MERWNPIVWTLLYNFKRWQINLGYATIWFCGLLKKAHPPKGGGPPPSPLFLKGWRVLYVVQKVFWSQKRLRRNWERKRNLDRVWKSDPGQKLFCRKIMKSLLAVRRGPEDGRNESVECIGNRIDGRIWNSSGKSSGAQKELRRKEKQNGNSSRVWKMNPGQKLFCRNL